MKGYSMDLRERVFADCDAGMEVRQVAVKLLFSLLITRPSRSGWCISSDWRNWRVSNPMSHCQLHP